MVAALGLASSEKTSLPVIIIFAEGLCIHVPKARQVHVYTDPGLQTHMATPSSLFKGCMKTRLTLPVQLFDHAEVQALECTVRKAHAIFLDEPAHRQLSTPDIIL